MRLVYSFILALVFSFGAHATDTATFIGGHVNDITSVAYSPDGEYIVTGSYDGHVFLYYNDSTPIYYLSFADHKSTVTSLAFSRDSRKLLAGGIDGRIMVYHFPHPDSMDYIRLDTIYEFSNRPVNKVVYGPGLRTVFSADDAGVLTTYDIKKKVVRSFKAEGPIKTFAVSVDRKHIYVASKGSADIVQYNTKGNEIRRFVGHQGEVNDIEVTLDRKYLISGSRDKSVKIWNLATGKLAISLSNHSWDVTGLTIDPYSRYVASCGLDGVVNIYEIANGKLIKSFKNLNGRCNDIAFSPDLSEVIVGLHMDSPGENGYGSNIWETGLSRPIKHVKGQRPPSTPKKTPTKTKTTNNNNSGTKSTGTVIDKSDQVEISIDKK